MWNFIHGLVDPVRPPLPGDSRCWRWPVRWSRRRRPPPTPAASRSPGRRSSCCSPRTVIIVGALTFFPSLAVGPIVEHFLMTSSTPDLLNLRGDTIMTYRQETFRVRARRSWSRRCEPASSKLDPRHMVSNPVMFVTEIGALDHHARDPARQVARRVARVRRPDLRSGCGSRCSSPTSPRRWPRGAARRRPTRCARAARRRSAARAAARRHAPRPCPRSSCARATSSSSPRSEIIAADGEIIDGRGDDRRVGHHRRIGAGASASRAATARPSPAARPCSPIRSASA